MEYGALFLFTLATSITPGPNNLMIMSSGVNFGFKRSLPHLLGIDVGFALMIVAVGLGMSQVFVQVPALLLWLKLAGVVYLSYLAFRIATTPTDVNAKTAKKTPAQPFSFMQAALFQWVNPKAWIMIVGAVVTYTAVDMNYPLQVAIIALFFLLFGTPCTFAWLGFGTALKQWLASPTKLKVFNISMASLLMLSLLPVILELVELGERLL
ncbi:MAG: LysE family translocator [Paraglaciecola sp.]|nr:LysE family translocator [Paraglaciecola sp.]NCT48870.1 LysE family translocator [Paraglaciecola sp.]